MSTLLTATDIVVRHNERVLLDRTTLAIVERDRLGMVGRNGSANPRCCASWLHYSPSPLRKGRAGVRCWRITGDPEFKAVEKEIRIHWLV